MHFTDQTCSKNLALRNYYACSVHVCLRATEMFLFSVSGSRGAIVCEQVDRAVRAIPTALFPPHFKLVSMLSG